jgi:hypothetical protein
MKKVRKLGASVLYALVAMLAVTPAFALGPGPDIDSGNLGGNIDEIGGLAGTLQAWLTGDLGLLIIMVGIIVATIMVVARASLMPILFVLGLSIFLGWGPTLFGAILGAEVTPAMLAAMG